jgi:hypothetical protein
MSSWVLIQEEFFGLFIQQLLKWIPEIEMQKKVARKSLNFSLIISVFFISVRRDLGRWRVERALVVDDYVSTTIRNGFPQRSYVVLSVYNTLSSQEATLVGGEQEAGYREVRFDCLGSSSGVYFCRLRGGDFVQPKKFLLIQ